MVRQDDAPGAVEPGVGAPPGGAPTMVRQGDASRGAERPVEADAGGGGPHHARVVVWGAPAAVERGERFSVRIGAACSSRCSPAGWRVEVRDQRGERLAAATLGDDPWPGADALRHAEAALVAPDAEGLHTWEATVLTEGLETVHTAGRARFGVRVVSAPACRLTVVAVDAESGEPVAGARVVAHPYRAVTDERGAAELRVAAGRYRLFVSGRGSVPFRFDGEVQADTTIRARLARDVELSDADIWS